MARIDSGCCSSTIATRRMFPSPKAMPITFPMVTVQLAIFNEMNVVERLMDYVAAMDWPREKLEIQLLDDSTDDTVEVAQAICDRNTRCWATTSVHPPY